MQKCSSMWGIKFKESVKWDVANFLSYVGNVWLWFMVLAVSLGLAVTDLSGQSCGPSGATFLGWFGDMSMVTLTAFSNSFSPPAACSLWFLSRLRVKEAVSEGRCLVTAQENSPPAPFLQSGGTREKSSSVHYPLRPTSCHTLRWKHSDKCYMKPNEFLKAGFG